MERKLKLKKIKTITGRIVVETGLHIGAGSDAIEIGGMDNPIIRHPATTEPYVPGSSLKGKLRSIMEWKENRVFPDQGSRRKAGDPCDCGECRVCRVFGCGLGGSDTEEKAQTRGPTRLIVRDAFVSERSRKEFAERGLSFVEEKQENTINRITAVANPRRLERVVPGVAFDLSISFRIFDRGDGDDGKGDLEDFREVVLTGLALLQQDCLGGGGSRGSGKVRFEDLRDEDGAALELPKV